MFVVALIAVLAVHGAIAQSSGCRLALTPCDQTWSSRDNQTFAYNNNNNNKLSLPGVFSRLNPLQKVSHGPKGVP